MGWTGQYDFQKYPSLTPRIFPLQNSKRHFYIVPQESRPSWLGKKWGVFICVCVFICFACCVCIFSIVPVFASATYLYFPRPRICIFLGCVFVFSSAAYLYFPRPRICICLGHVFVFSSGAYLYFPRPRAPGPL